MQDVVRGRWWAVALLRQLNSRIVLLKIYNNNIVMLTHTQARTRIEIFPVKRFPIKISKVGLKVVYHVDVTKRVCSPELKISIISNVWNNAGDRATSKECYFPFVLVHRSSMSAKSLYKNFKAFISCGWLE